MEMFASFPTIINVNYPMLAWLVGLWLVKLRRGEKRRGSLLTRCLNRSSEREIVASWFFSSSMLLNTVEFWLEGGEGEGGNRFA